MSKRSVALFVVLLALIPCAAAAGTITFSSGLTSPALRVTFDPQPEPPGISGGLSAVVAPADPVDAFWFSLQQNDMPLALLGVSPLTSAAGAKLFGLSAAYGGVGGAGPSYFLDVMFDPQPEPPGKWALVMFDPQPEPPGSWSIVRVGLDGAPLGFDAFISSFDPQPEPPGLGNLGAFWFYEGSILQGQFTSASFALRTSTGNSLGLTPVPEPVSTLTLLGGALLALAQLRRKLTK